MRTISDFPLLILTQPNPALSVPASIAPALAPTHLVPPRTEPSLYGPRLAFGHRFNFHPGTSSSNDVRQSGSITSSGKLRTIDPLYVLMFLHIEAHIHMPVAAPSAPAIDPFLSGPKDNAMEPNHADASDDEDQADAESESSGSENGQGPVLIQSRIFSN